MTLRTLITWAALLSLLSLLLACPPTRRGGGGDDDDSAASSDDDDAADDFVFATNSPASYSRRDRVGTPLTNTLLILSKDDYNEADPRTT